MPPQDLAIQFKRWEGNVDLPLPRYATDGAAGFDIQAAVEAPVTLHPGERKLGQAFTGDCAFLIIGHAASPWRMRGLRLLVGMEGRFWGEFKATTISQVSSGVRAFSDRAWTGPASSSARI